VVRKYETWWLIHLAFCTFCTKLHCSFVKRGDSKFNSAVKSKGDKGWEVRGLDPQISAVSTRDCIDSRSRESSDVALFVVDYHDGRVRVCVVSVFAERPSYASDYDDDDNDSLLADDSDARYQPVFRLERFTQSLIYSLTAHINCSETSSVAAGFGRHGMPPPAYNLTFDRLTLKLMCESYLRWGTFLPNLAR